MTCIAYETEIIGGRTFIRESTGEDVTCNNIEDALTFILEPYPGQFKVTWNLDEEIAPILKLIPIEALKLLNSNKSIVMPPWEIWYYRGKTFGARHIPSKQACYLYCLEQFFPEVEHPGSLDGVASRGNILIKSFASMGIKPWKLTSPIAILRDAVQKVITVPRLDSMPLAAAQLAYQCSGKEWIEAYKLGKFENAWDYDISSAFPNVLKSMIDPTYHSWVESKVYQPSAFYGYCEGVVEVNAEVSPIVFTDDSGSCTPRGRWPTQLTKTEIDYLKESGKGDFTCERGWWLLPNRAGRAPIYPLKDFFNYLQEWKELGGIVGAMAKRMMVGFYGTLGEIRDEGPGPFYFSPWFAEASSQTRVNLAKFIDDNQLEDSLVHVMVDGIVSERKAANVPKTWKENPIDEILIASSGMVMHGEKHPHGITIEEAETLICANPSKLYYSTTKKRRITLGDAIEQNMVDRVGEYGDFQTSLNLAGEHDRVFTKRPQSGIDILKKHYTSKARVINVPVSAVCKV